MSEYRWLNKHSQEFLARDYLRKDQTVDDRVTEIGLAAEKILKKPGYAERFKENMKKGWYSLATPVWTNFGTDRGLPISCYGSSIDDSCESILYTVAEVGMMSKHGGGTSAYFGNLRPRGAPIKNNGHSYGSVHFMQLFETTMNIISQGSTRRGSFAAILPVEHPDIKEFLTIRDEGNPIQDLSFGVTITDAWMNEMIDGDNDKRQIWAKILESRVNKGYPYIMFVDTVNRNVPEVYKDKGLKVLHSNLCQEINLANNNEESFVCCLSSMNLVHYDEWKDTDAVEILTFLLDAVMSEFIEKAKTISFMERAVKFAENQRAIGLGVLGWHSFLQSKMIAWDSLEAYEYSDSIFKNIRDKAYSASHKLAKEFGEPELLKGYGRRNTTLLAIAPTKSSSFILGQVSEGIEPMRANYYIKDAAKGKFSLKNEYLEKLLIEKDKNTENVWESILKHRGSVQHLDFLTADEKSVFKTFQELDQYSIIVHAAIRQAHIDQSQSLNVMIHPSTPAKDVSKLYIEAWKQGVKTLYYQIGVNAAQEFHRSIISCAACEA